MYHQTEEARLRRRQTKEAIALAMQGRWQEAVAANKAIIEVFPKDVNAYNRLGKSLTELGLYEEAKAAYSKALEISPKNSIARKNLRRLSLLKEVKPSRGMDHHKAAPHLFIEEMGKTGIASLKQPASREALAKLAAGDPVHLRVSGKSVIVENDRGDYLGKVESKIGMRLAKLIAGGNRYTAAITSLADHEVKIIIKEIFQHPGQAGRPAFPAKEPEDFRPYVRDSILKYDLEDEDTFEDMEDASEWEEEAEEEPLPEGISLIPEDGDEDIDTADVLE